MTFLGKKLLTFGLFLNQTRASPWRIGLRHGLEERDPGSIPGEIYGVLNHFSLNKHLYSPPRFKLPDKMSLA